MPAFNDDVTIPAGAWTQITAGDVAALRVQNVGGAEVRLKAAAGAVEPTAVGGGIVLQPYAAMAADLTLAQLFPGVSGANRVYAYCSGNTKLSVSHA